MCSVRHCLFPPIQEAGKGRENLKKPNGQVGVVEFEARDYRPRLSLTLSIARRGSMKMLA